MAAARAAARWSSTSANTWRRWRPRSRSRSASSSR